MKAIFIIFNQAWYEMILTAMDQSNIKGFTYWESVAGRGSNTGEPHYGSHAWPTLNGTIWTIVEERKVEALLRKLRQLDQNSEMLGLRAFVLNVEQSI